MPSQSAKATRCNASCERNLSGGARGAMTADNARGVACAVSLRPITLDSVCLPSTPNDHLHILF